MVLTRFAHRSEHSVTQSSFAAPCTYLAAANGSSGGFDSGIQTSKQFTIQITNDQERKPTFLSRHHNRPFFFSC